MTIINGRKIIFKGVHGSHLYGTNIEGSDLDYVGVFLPSKADLLGTGSCPTEMTFNEEGVDCKFFSLKRFFDLVAQGQPGQLEQLFIPPHQWIESSPEWDTIQAHRHLFITQDGIRPFIGFALAQAHKSTIKGGNLNIIRNLIADLEASNQLHVSIQEHFISRQVWIDNLSAELITVSKNDHGFEVLEVAGRKYDINLKAKTLLQNLKELERRYGDRSNKAAELGTDFKSLMHAERLMNQAAEFLGTGHITLPRPEAEDLIAIRQGIHGRSDWHQYLQDRITTLRTAESTLPLKPDRPAIDVLCQTILWDWLNKS